MAAKPGTGTAAAERRRLTERMLKLDQIIDSQAPGSPKRLELLRQQANLSDRREALVSDRY